MKIPTTGRTREEILEHLESYKKQDINWQSGRAYGYIYDPGKEILEFAKQVYCLFLCENALDFTAYPSLLKIENDLISMIRKHLRGGDQVVGNFTSGGTESIFLAMKAARDYYRQEKPEIKEPEIILPSSAHAAFHKAAHYLDIQTVTVSVDPDTFKADLKKTRERINENTILMAGSAPTYTQGVVDPISELSELARKNNIWFHTDACMGGFLLPYFRRLGEPVADFDFSLPGVCSVSVDLHKYAYAPKGASLVFHRSPKLRSYHIFSFTKWLGYTLVNSTLQSTKSGGPLAAAWAVLNYIGDQGYLDFARKKREAVKKIKQAISQIPELHLMVEPEMTLISFGSKEVNIFHIIDEMNLKGWYIQPSLSFDGIPANIHLTVTLSNVLHTDPFIHDLQECVEKAKKLPSGALLKKIQPFMDEQEAGLLENPGLLFEIAGIQDGQMPQRMAPINEVLDAMPVSWREKLLLHVANGFFHPDS